MRILYLSILIGLYLPSAFAQKQASSPSYSFAIKPKVEPPILQMPEASLRFTDTNANGAIDAQEACAIEFALENTGFGDALNLLARIETLGTTAGIHIDKQISLPKVSVGATTHYRIPISSDMFTANGTLMVKIMIQEPNGFDPTPIAISIETRAFQSPLLRITDFAITGEGKLEAMKPFTLQLILQNTGQGKADNISTALTLPENVMNIGADTHQNLIALEPGESRKLQYALIINARYNADSLPLSMKIQEKHGRYAEDWKQSFELHQQIAAPRELVVQAIAAETKNFETASFKSDVDRDIPISVKKNPNRYALVIGNENYASRNANLSKSINVDYAQNDADVFAEYLKSAFGIPIENIKRIINATSGEMRSGLSWLENNARAYGASVELYFFYSGHGLPTDADRSPHLIPVDISGERPEQGIALKEVYEKLTQHPAQKITVVLDACFSGGARNEELIARKGVRVQPKAGNIPGNMVVLTSSNGNQSSAVFREKKHGFLTYYLLKGIQSQGTETTYGKLFEYTTRQVDIEASRLGILQQPQIQYGPDISDTWKSWGIE